MKKEEILREFIEKFCIPTIHDVQLDPEKMWQDDPEKLKERQEMVNWLKELLDRLGIK